MSAHSRYRMQVYLSKSIHTSVIAYSSNTLFVGLSSMFRGFSDDNRGVSVLYDMDWDIERPAQCKDFGLTAPYRRVPHLHAISLECSWRYKTCVGSAYTIFPVNRRQEGYEIIRVLEDVI